MNHINQKPSNYYYNIGDYRGIIINYRKIVVLGLLILSLWVCYIGSSFSTEMDTTFKGVKLGFNPFSIKIFKQHNLRDILAILGLIWLIDQLLMKKGSDLGKKNYFLKALLFRALIVIPMSLAVSAIFYGIRPEPFWIKTFLHNLLIPITFIFSWEASRKKHITIDSIISIFQIILILNGIFLLGKLVLNTNVINEMTTRKEVFNFNLALMMIALFTFSAVNIFLNSSKTKLVDKIGLIVSSLIMIFSLKRVAWVELIAVVIILYYAIFKYRNQRPNNLLTFIIIFIIMFILTQPLLQIYGGTFSDLGERFSSIFLFVTNPLGAENLERSVFGSSNTSSGHEIAVLEGIYNVIESPIIGKGYFATFSLYFFPNEIPLGGGPHAGYFYHWVLEGILGFLSLMFIFGYLICYGWSIYKRNNDKYALLLVLLGVAEFLRGITWPNIFLTIENWMPYMILFGVLLQYLNQKYNNIKTERLA